MIYRMSKTGLISDSYRNQSFTMMVQDNICKMQTLKLKITVLNDHGQLQQLESIQSTMKIKPRINVNYKRWVQAAKTTQRPIWVDAEISSCFICEREFGMMERQHHCRKCGTAVCTDCSGYKVELPELAYYEPVRVCSNCFDLLRLTENEQDYHLSSAYLGFRESARCTSFYANQKNMDYNEHFRCQSANMSIINKQR